MMSYFELQRWIRGGCVLLCVVTGSAAQGALIAHYKFDETTGSTAANEVFANGGDGAIGANVTLGVAGVDGNAIRLPVGHQSADILSMGSAPDIFQNIDASGQLTISYWLSSTHTAGGRNVAVFMGNNLVQNSYIDTGIVGGTTTPVGRAQGRNRGPNTTTASQIGELFSPNDVLVNDGEFHHIALTIDINTGVHTGALYVDGELASTETLASKYQVFPDFNVFEVGRLGRGGNGPTDGFAGLIDDLQIYDTALTARQVGNLFANPGQVVPEPATISLFALGLTLVATRRRLTAC